MNNLHLIFFLIGTGLFLVIVLYSVFKKKQKERIIDADTSSYISSGDVEADYVEPTVDDSGDLSEFESIAANTTNRITAKERLAEEPKLHSEPTIVEATPSDAPTKNNTSTSGANLELEARSSDVVSNVQAKPQVDEQSSTIITELVAKIKNPLPIEQQELLTLFRLHDFKFNRGVHIFGLNQLTEKWRDIEFELPSARFVELGVSIQLADQDGAMSEKELHDFQQMVLDFTTKFDAPFEFSMQIDEAYEQGQALDTIGRRYDSMAVLNIASKTPSGFRAADLGSCARDLMMSVDKNGIYLKTIGQKDDISVLYRLACTDGAGNLGYSNLATSVSHDLIMYMNVPATKDPESVFKQMIDDANSLATWLEGKVVDRNRHAMTQRSYDVLMQQIIDITTNMQEDGLKPGDSVSKKLF